jgi:hypothetical protein
MGSYRTRTAKHADSTLTRPLLGTEGGTSSSTTEVLADNPVMRRAAVAVQYMISKGDKSSKAVYMRIVSKIVTEALSDASEVPPEIAEFYMKQLSAMIWWVGTGDAPTDIPMPDDFVTGERKAIE